MELRRPYLKKLRRRLQKEIADPRLSSDKRKVLERDLSNLGQPKIYDSNDPPAIGALHPGERPPITLEPEHFSFEKLASLPHTTLYLYALKEGLEVLPGEPKAQIVKRILENHQGEKA